MRVAGGAAGHYNAEVLRQPTADVTATIRRPLSFDRATVGSFCGIFSAVGYTAANICLRAVTHCDPVWVSCIKALPLVVLVGPLLVVRAARSQGIAPSLRVLGGLALAGLFGQLAGNVLFQWSLGVVGLALAVPLTLGAMILCGAVLGHWLLGERLTARMLVAIVLLIIAIVVLSLGAPAANASVLGGIASQRSVWLLAAGVVGATLSGVAYCVLGAVIRTSVDGGTPVVTILFTVGLVGLVALATLAYTRIGLGGMWETAPRDMSVMLLAGLCNVAAFFALTKALHLTNLTYVNALNASQTAMAAVAGVFFFSEAPTWPMGLGVALTAAGLLVTKNDRRP